MNETLTTAEEALKTVFMILGPAERERLVAEMAELAASRMPGLAEEHAIAERVAATLR